MNNDILESRAAGFFRRVMAYPKTIVLAGILLIALNAAFLPRIVA